MAALHTNLLYSPIFSIISDIMFGSIEIISKTTQDITHALWQMRHTDYKLLDDRSRWFIAYQDDASRFITGHGVSAHATGKHAIDVLHAAIKRHSKPCQNTRITSTTKPDSS